MNFCDSSVLIASFASWHEHHNDARAVVPGSGLIGHVATETYSVLTRLPAPHRLDGAHVTALLERQFVSAWQVLPGKQHAALVARLPGLGITGGAVYDALIAATAAAAGGTLVSLDRRATQTYERVGAQTRLLLD